MLTNCVVYDRRPSIWERHLVSEACTRVRLHLHFDRGSHEEGDDHCKSLIFLYKAFI